MTQCVVLFESTPSSTGLYEGATESEAITTIVGIGGNQLALFTKKLKLVIVTQINHIGKENLISVGRKKLSNRFC
jgi:hypothetical protein